jgi:hypothetical protein
LGPTFNSAPVVLSGRFVEESDDDAGDITLARATFELFKAGNLGSTPDMTVSDVAVNSDGVAEAVASLTADVWTVKVKVDPGNGYWNASPVGMDIVTVAVGNNDRRVVGGGWVPDQSSANGKGNFGFTVAPIKNLANIRGNSVFVFRGLDGFDYVVKSTSWQGGSMTFLGDPVSNARFSGRATVQKIDPATGTVVDSYGNYSFTVELRDGDLLTPGGSDAYGITVLTNVGVLWYQVGGTNSPVDLGGGSVSIKAR